MQIIKNILTVLLVLSVTAFMTVTTFGFGKTEEITLTEEKKREILAYTAKVGKDESAKSYIQKSPTKNNESIVLDKGSTGYIEFGLLASAFILPDGSGSVDYREFSLSGTILTMNTRYPAVVSLYDPFTMYRIAGSEGTFAITQITNGSFYIGNENDQTISLYSVDAVIRLDFLYDGKVMTDMMLFPGMYIRFDPKSNVTLEGANLFRILQSLELDGTQDMSQSNTTGIEFVNPRMDSATSNKDSFFMYRLPIDRNILFQMLHVMFYDEVSQIELYKKYGISAFGYTITFRDHAWFMNPGKKSHFLLLQLDSILSNALQNNVSIDFFKKQITDINEQAKTLGLGNGVQLRMERFLTEGRFALFGSTAMKINPNFPEIYQAASDAVGKTPVTAHAKLLQKLSDIYSKNLVTQKKDLSFSRIDTYSPTALELERTLNSADIQQRDYFDIALYAFNVLKKAEDKGMFIDEAVYLYPTYSLINTILLSTDRYSATIKDPERKAVTYQGIALHFYDHIFQVLARSVYHTFMQEEDGHLYLKPAFRPTNTEPKIHIDETLIRNIESVAGTINLIDDKLDNHYGETSTNNVFLSMKKSIEQFYGFAKILNYEAYNEYVKTPYIVDEKSEFLLPLYTSGALQSSDVLSGILSEKTQANPTVEKIVSLLGGIPKTLISKGSGYYSIKGATYNIKDQKTNETLQVKLSLDVPEDMSMFSNVTIVYKDKTIPMAFSDEGVDYIPNILNAIPAYISRYNEIMAGNPSLEGEVRFLDTTKKIMIGIYPFPLVP